MMPKEVFHTHSHSESAKIHMVTRVCRAVAKETVAEVLARLQDHKALFDTVDYVYVLDNNGVLQGVVSIKELLNAHDTDMIGDLMTKNLAMAHLATHQETVANMALKYNIKAVPVVDEGRHFLGVVPSDAIINVLQWEHSEDLMKLSGVRGKGRYFKDLLRAGVFKMSRLRIPSLLVGLVGGLLATLIVKFFEGALEEHLVLAFFIPLIVYINNAVGTQTQTLFVRTLALEALEKTLLRKYVFRELMIGFMIGTVIALGILGIAWFWFKEPVVAFTIGLSILIGSTVATILGMAVPYLLYTMKKDPAISGGPFATILQDILSLVIYFSVAAVILR